MKETFIRNIYLKINVKVDFKKKIKGIRKCSWKKKMGRKKNDMQRRRQR